MHGENCTLPGNVVCLVCTCTPGAPSSPRTCRLAFHYPLIRPRLIFPPPPHPRPRFPSIWKLFRAVEDGENWPISLADRSLSELVEFRANFSGWDVPGILEYFPSFFWIPRLEIGQFFPPSLSNLVFGLYRRMSFVR